MKSWPQVARRESPGPGSQEGSHSSETHRVAQKPRQEVLAQEGRHRNS